MGLFSFGNSSADKKLNWVTISSLAELNEAIDKSNTIPSLFFKHSTRCSISSMALSRLENEWGESNSCNLYFIDLIAHRDVSNALAEKLNVFHQSPQAILIRNEKVIYDASHGEISATAIKEKIS
ncbi:MAG: bacillithiol system redox-active protein YtxJ [Brumimicrobium sp.]